MYALLLDLPTEVRRTILLYLLSSDLREMALTCRQLNVEVKPIMKENYWHTVSITCYQGTLQLVEFYDRIVTDPSIAYYVKQFSFGYSFGHQRWHRDKQHEKLLVKHSYLSVQLQHLVNAGVIEPVDKDEFQHMMRCGYDEPIWLVVYSMLPHVRQLRVWGMFRPSMSLVTEKLVKYLTRPALDLALDRNIRFPSPVLLHIESEATYHRTPEEYVGCNLLLLPSVRAVTFGGELKPILGNAWAFHVPAWITELNNSGKIRSNIEYMYWHFGFFPPEELVKMIELTPKLSVIQFRPCSQDYDRSQVCQGCDRTCIDYTDADGNFIFMFSGAEYMERLRYFWEDQHGHSELPCKLAAPICGHHRSYQPTLFD